MFAVTIPIYRTVNGKRNYSKPDYCFYCGGRYTSAIGKHILNCHSDQKKVQDLLLTPPGSQIRSDGLHQIRNMGNYSHNIKVLKSLIYIAI
jgi:hypothetical protein